MAEYITASIVIQARSTSTRFPGKIYEKIGNKQILQHVLDACYNSANYVNAYTNRHNIVCGVALAVPIEDQLLKSYGQHVIVQGPEDDVLKRYDMAANRLNSDFIIRITSDCPFIPPFIISKMLSIAVKDGLDFLTNADPRFRTSPDGHDCEIMSRRLLMWLNENAKTPEHREHVTSYLQVAMPSWAKKADVIGFTDLSSVKLSVDTMDDLDRLTLMYNKLYTAIKTSPKNYRL